MLDEIEKAHPDVFNVLLQVMDDGRLTDGQGRTVDFRNTVLILTSNLGTGETGKQLGFSGTRSASDGEHRDRVSATEHALKDFFRPEFLNRLDEIIVFEPLAQPELLQIVDLMVIEERARLEQRGLTFELTDAAREALGEEGHDPAFGARPLRRVIQRRLENPLSRELLSGRFAEGDCVMVDFVEGDFVFERRPGIFQPAPAEEQAAEPAAV